MKKKVIILGGGIAGMSAAHELIERGFEVHVYEQKSIAGGKARSIPYPKTGRDGRKDLLGEHGFRFFPRFYKHVTDTMKRIPFGDNRQGVFDNLVDTTRIRLARENKPPVDVVSRFPRSLEDLKVIFRDLFESDLEIPPQDVEFFAERIWQIATSCQDRRLEEYEKIGWWDYLEGSKRSKQYQSLLVKGMTRSLVASKAELASTRTVGTIFFQLILDILEPGVSSDRVLNGPTSDAWLNPWLNYLQTCGVNYHLNAQVLSINCDASGHILGVTINDLDNQEAEYTVTGDYYVSALPIEILSGLLTDEMLNADPRLANVQRLSLSTAWMNGIQFFLTEDPPINHGHILHVDSPWALTSISQKQFWPGFDFSDYGDGSVKGVLSVCISDWGFYVDPNTQLAGITSGSEGEIVKKRAAKCTREEIRDEVWHQLKQSLNVDGKVILKDEDRHDWFLDSDIETPDQQNFEAYLKAALSKPLRRLFICIMTLEEDKGYTTLDEIAASLRYGEQDTVKLRTQIDQLVGRGFVSQDPNFDDRYHTCLENPEQINLEPLLVNLINTWHMRPDVATRIPNFFLAGDYVRTNTDLATMEGANEAARRAVNCIIDAAGVKAPYCKIWRLEEPEFLALWKFHDYIRYKQGLPWSEQLPVPFQALQSLYNLISQWMRQ